MKISEKISYLIVGVLNTLAYYISIYFLYIVFHLNEYLSIFLSYVVALTIAMILNLSITFKGYDKSMSIVLQYIKIILLVFIANIIFTKLCFYLMSDDFIAIQILFSILFFMLNYYLIKKKVFKWIK